jgi:hypothetical protein
MQRPNSREPIPVELPRTITALVGPRQYKTGQDEEETDSGESIAERVQSVTQWWVEI